MDLATLQQLVGNGSVQRALVPSARPRLGPNPVLRPAALAGAGAHAGHDHDADHGMIHRHSSWEHQQLGDSDPKVLAQIGTWQDLIAQTKLTGKLGSRTREKEAAEVTIPGIPPVKVNKGQVMHVVGQEMARLRQWQVDPPKKPNMGDPLTPVGKDADYGVLMVTLPDGLVITYGEMNTLADFYGDVETMKKADPKNRRQVVQSVRKETYLRFKEIYDALNDSLTSTEKKSQDVKDAKKLFKDEKLSQEKLLFSGSITPKYISGMAGQIELLKGVQSTGASGATNAYGATLGRNACHFVPESWHAWADNHANARNLALAAHAARNDVNTLRQAMALEDYARRPLDRNEAEMSIKLKEAAASKLANEAIMTNGFGDHYLQDSYASGHMINKTQVMKWYVQYIDNNKEWDYHKDENWRKVQQMAYRQPELAGKDQYDKKKVKGTDPTGQSPENRARNPQSVESDKSLKSWEERFTALGLRVPPSLSTPGSPERMLVEWWQTRALNSGARDATGADLQQGAPIRDQALQTACINLIRDGVLRTGEGVETRGKYMGWNDKQIGNAAFRNFAKAKLLLRDDYVPKDKDKFEEALKNSSEKGDDSGYQKMAKAVTYGDYIAFMNSAFIQKATNALHDTFCKGGLDVGTGDGTFFKVYGDDAMFSKGAAAGVEHSAQTANMSRDAILNTINGGETVAKIMGRLPNHVRVKVEPGGKTADTSIEDWHNPDKGPSLQNFCNTQVFPGMSWSLVQKFAPGVLGGELGAISQDMNVHAGEGF
ncbi:MAG: hypothetical protein IT303_13585 [Dehalococcoidia bacterium]|nr:hypothetical protein [Dehalococcoidia bacterium]